MRRKAFVIASSEAPMVFAVLQTAMESDMILRGRWVLDTASKVLGLGRISPSIRHRTGCWNYRKQTLGYVGSGAIAAFAHCVLNMVNNTATLATLIETTKNLDSAGT